MHFCISNLAVLLKDTNRLVEAEPLMRRQYEICAFLRADTGHTPPGWEESLGDYRELLVKQGRTKEQAQAVTDEILRAAEKERARKVN